MKNDARPITRLRVGIISNSFASEADAHNGGLFHVLQVAKRWTHFDIIFFAPEHAREVVGREIPGATFIPAFPKYTPGWLRGAPLICFRLLFSFARMRQIRTCDVVLTSTAFLADILPTAFVRRGRVAVIVQHLQTAPWRRPGNALANIMAYVTERLGLALGRNNAALWFLNDIGMARRLSLNLNRTTIKKMTHGVDHLRDFAGHIDVGRTGALYIGRLHPTKGLDDLLRAWKIVVASLPDSQLRLVGTGTQCYKSSLQRSVKALGLTKNVKFLGAVDETTKCKELRRARVFAFPSLEEGWGIAIAEAMTFALPCITYDLPAYNDVFTAGRIEIRRRDIFAFASALSQILVDDVEWERLSGEAAALATSFTWERAARIEEDALRLLVDRELDPISG